MLKQVFTVSGMTCDNCRSDVQQTIEQLPQVIQARVDLASGEAQLEVHETLTAADLEKKLGTKYTVVSRERSAAMPSGATSPSKLRQLFPLFLIFCYLILGVLYLNAQNFQIQSVAHDFMGLFFIVFSFFKFLDYNGFPASFARYDPLAKRSIGYAKVYPFIEAALGIAFLLRWQVKAAIIITFLVLLSTTIGVIKSLLDKKSIDCACLGTALKLPMTEATLIENLIMLVMCILAFSIGS